MEVVVQNFVLLLPLFVLQFALLVYCVVDLIKTDESRIVGNKIIWLLVILLINLIGPIMYLIFGKGE